MRVRGVGLFLLALGACSSRSGPAPDGGAAPAKRLLVVTHTAAFRHDSIPTAEATIAAVAGRIGGIEVSYARDAGEVVAKLGPATALDYDGYFFANTTGNVGIPDVAAFLAAIAAGRAFLGAHSASDTYHEEPGYSAMLGGEFLQHGAQSEVEIVVEAADHPAGAPLAPSFRIFDEIYEFVANPRPNVQVIFATRTHPDDGHPEAGQPGDFPLAWWKLHGEGRVFYTALGHRSEVWMDPRYQQHLEGALRWALRLP